MFVYYETRNFSTCICFCIVRFIYLFASKKRIKTIDPCVSSNTNLCYVSYLVDKFRTYGEPFRTKGICPFRSIDSNFDRLISSRNRLSAERLLLPCFNLTVVNAEQGSTIDSKWKVHYGERYWCNRFN